MTLTVSLKLNSKAESDRETESHYLPSRAHIILTYRRHFQLIEGEYLINDDQERVKCTRTCEYNSVPGIVAQISLMKITIFRSAM